MLNTQHYRRKVFCIFFLLTVSHASGQDLNVERLPERTDEFSLFGEVDSNSDAVERNTGRTGRRSRNSLDRSEPEFTLVGTSRIGSRYSAILKNRDGSEVIVSAEQGRNSRIEGYSSYSVVDVGPGRVSIQFPSTSSCIEFQDQGVSCNSAANIASLELAIGEPVPRAMITTRDDSGEGEDQVEVSEGEPEEPTNPFAQLRARALEEGNVPVPAETPRRAFSPRRIDPADVPPGMRVVSTPFGDRLVRE